MSQAAFSFVFYFKVRFLALNFHALPKVLLRYFLVARGNSKKDILLIFCTDQIVQWIAEKTGLFDSLVCKMGVLRMGIMYLESAALLFLCYVRIDMTWGFQISYFSSS